MNHSLATPYSSHLFPPALIALLSDSYAQIQESATANKRLARCGERGRALLLHTHLISPSTHPSSSYTTSELIADYLNILPRAWRKKAEQGAAVEVLERSNLQKIIFLRATGQTSLQTSAWEGQVNAIRKQTETVIKKSEKRVTALLQAILEEVSLGDQLHRASPDGSGEGVHAR